MAALPNRPLFTYQYDEAAAIQPPPGSTYIFGLAEERSEHVKLWQEQSVGVEFVVVEEKESPFITANGQHLSLRRKDDVRAFLSGLPNQTLYIDMTGLSHHVWAPLIAVALEVKKVVKGVYVEPVSYKYSDHPLQGEIFDLSERIGGISPLPMFASLSEPRSSDICLIPLIGFEGARFAYIVEQVDPPGGKVYPIIGVPGFRIEYPFHTYLGNQHTLDDNRSWQNVRYARANCPFQTFYAIEDIAKQTLGAFIKLAPVGTKPHALGAVLYSLASAQGVEIVYDNPKRKSGRTEGLNHFLLYEISAFLRNNPHSKAVLAA
jgi:hypothetical protein